MSPQQFTLKFASEAIAPDRDYAENWWRTLTKAPYAMVVVEGDDGKCWQEHPEAVWCGDTIACYLDHEDIKSITVHATLEDGRAAVAKLNLGASIGDWTITLFITDWS